MDLFGLPPSLPPISLPPSLPLLSPCIKFLTSLPLPSDMKLRQVSQSYSEHSLELEVILLLLCGYGAFLVVHEWN